MIKTFDNIVAELKEAGAVRLDEMIKANGNLIWFEIPDGERTLTWRDPSKPPLTGFKRYPVLKGWRFALCDVRSTKSNLLIFGLVAGPAEQEAMKKRSKGPGLSDQYTIAELTLREVEKYGDTGAKFVREIWDMYDDWRAEELAPAANVDRGALWGSW